MSSSNKDALKSTKVFFMHMSVGDDIIGGHNNWSAPWKAGTNSLGFMFGWIDKLSDFSSKTLGHVAFGQNGNPTAKINMFQDRMLKDSYGSAVKVAGYKFCYNDLKDGTHNVSNVISSYQASFNTIEAGTSGVSFFHVTTPLQPTGQSDAVKNNQMRMTFANFLKTTYTSGRHVVLDLQEIESTKANSDKCTQSGTPVLCPEWAYDADGHLSDAAATRAAKAFLYALHVARGL